MKPAKSQPRTVNFHGTFAPYGGHPGDQKTFLEFWLAGQEKLTTLGGNDLRRRKAASKEFISLRRKALALLNQMLKNELPVEATAEKLKRLLPNEKLRREIFDFWSNAIKRTPDQRQKEEDELAREGARLARDEKILTARKTISRWVTTLNDMAATGDEKAVEALVEAAYLSSLAVIAFEKQQPKMMERIARRQTVWPILTDGKPEWEKLAVERLTRLNLGADMTFYRTRFRQPRGAEVNLPARKWAKAAVRAIEDTRFRFLAFSGMLNGFESAGRMADFMLENGWNYGDTPAWVDGVCKLSAFSTESLPAWKRVIRKMIRQQMQNFQERPEWATQRASAIARERGTPGEIQNAILDDICSALERLAPPANLPKSVC